VTVVDGHRVRRRNTAGVVERKVEDPQVEAGDHLRAAAAWDLHRAALGLGVPSRFRRLHSRHLDVVRAPGQLDDARVVSPPR